MTGRYSKQRIPILLVLVATLVSTTFADVSAQSATCWSLLESKFGPDLNRAVTDANPCERLPGFDKKDRFELKILDICSALNGATVKVEAELICKTSDKALIRAKLGGKLRAAANVDIGACKVSDVEIEVSGDVGKALGNSNSLREFAKQYAQKELSQVCQPNG